MEIRYDKWRSPSLGRDMEIKVYGQGGKRFAFHIKRQGHLRKCQHSARGDHRQLCEIIHFDFFIHCFASILQSRGLPTR